MHNTEYNVGQLIFNDDEKKIQFMLIYSKNSLFKIHSILKHYRLAMHFSSFKFTIQLILVSLPSITLNLLWQNIDAKIEECEKCHNHVCVSMLWTHKSLIDMHEFISLNAFQYYNFKRKREKKKKSIKLCRISLVLETAIVRIQRRRKNEDRNEREKSLSHLIWCNLSH